MERYYGIIALLILLVVLVIFIKYQSNKDDIEVLEEEKAVVVKNDKTALDVNDTDALVACLIASIESRNDIKKNVQVISVRRVS